MAKRIAVDDCLTLDLSEPCVRSIVDLRRDKVGTLHWASGGIDVAAIGFDWRRLARRLIITATIGGEPMTQTIAVTTTHPHFGGVRLWFCCPQTGERARMLFLAPGRRQWASRTALGLAYASQRMGPSERRLNRLIHHVNASERRSAIRRLRRSGTCT